MSTSSHTAAPPEELNSGLLYQHLAATASPYSSGYFLRAMEKLLDRDSVFDATEERLLLTHMYEAVAMAYKTDPLVGAKLMSDLIKPVTAHTAEIFQRLVTGLQVNTALFNYAQYSATNEDDYYTMVTCLFMASRREELLGAVADGCTDLLGKPAPYLDEPLALQHYMAREFFGVAWEALYVSELMSAADVVKDIMQLRPPFVQAAPVEMRDLDLPANYSSLP